MQYFVYILCNFNNTVMYVGRTENLPERIRQHRLKLVEGFTKKYNVTKLVYYEAFESKEEAAAREWKLKKWKREWKNNLVITKNPNWDDLYPELLKLAS